MKKFYSWIVCPLVVIVTVALVYRLYQKFNSNSTDVNIKFIRSHISASGRITDPHGEICCESIDDIRLYVTKDKVTIMYGKIQLEWKYNDFLDERYDIDLGALKILRKVDPDTGELKVYYGDQEIPRYAK